MQSYYYGIRQNSKTIVNMYYDKVFFLIFFCCHFLYFLNFYNYYIFLIHLNIHIFSVGLVWTNISLNYIIFFLLQIYFQKKHSGVSRIKVQPIEEDVESNFSGESRRSKRSSSGGGWCCDCMTAHRLDRVCMVAFIQIFIIFVIVYWTSFMVIND